ncbi:proline--tRNA ligase [Bowdeniella nasicola]|uniref:Proline--tRNA ligase n=1 Tax=Bowdeniella nasicola TaxID=208480 RepID=A0A1Q5Q5T2_9ACTO|nr:proline--tRNA ligase [Bowdeniella nasicola]OKL55143.1 proline--tRNA ligase [Bowdeniella nasicola]
MMTRLTQLFLRTLRETPADADVASHQLLVRAGYIRRAAPGIYTWLPLGLKVLRKVEAIVREEMEAIGGQEVHFPALLPAEPYRATNRWEEYGPNLFRLQDRRENDYLLAPTHEEMFTLAVKDMYSSYKDLPATIFQIQTKYRDEARPRAGLIRGREFVMKDSYSFDIDDEGLDAAYSRHRVAYEKMFTRLGLDYVICEAMSGAMGGSKSEEFLFPTAIGEDTFVRSPGGYTANAEAIQTPTPEDVDFSDVPAPAQIHTPGAKTIATLVDGLNAEAAREQGWSAADTLKHVVLKVTHPTEGESLLVVGLPGDRDVDLKRVEAALVPAEVEPASEDDFKAYPELVPGFIGTGHIGPQGRKDEDGNSVITYLMDARVARGSAWATGGDEGGYHTINNVFGRDFDVDGRIEAAEIREGDPAPDGSGPLELARGIEIGHIFQLGRKYAKALGLSVLDENGKARVVTMGSYGVGISRIVAALAEEYHDEHGLTWPIQVAPAHIHIVATGKDPAIFEAATQLAEDLDDAQFDVIYDDRPKVSAGVKFADAELLGAPNILVVGRGLAEGTVELRNRVTGEKRELDIAEASQLITDELTAQLLDADA